MKLSSVVSAACLLAAVATAQPSPEQTGLGVESGPWIRPTRGEIWPKPRDVYTYHNNGYMVLRTDSFRFNVTRKSCDILDDALIRYYKYLVLEREAGFIEFSAKSDKSSNEINRGQEHVDSRATFRGFLDSLDVDLMAPCENLPYFGMDEHYELRIDSPDMPRQGKLVSHTIWGVLRGLETFVQLAAPSQDGTALHLNSSAISDYPRFPYRGLMVDTSRHFFPKKTLFKLIDGMEASKLNVFHWHIVDDQSFPYQSRSFPELSEKGAYNPLSHVYSQNDVKEIIEYCRRRGIRVIPEFDTPGHTRSWGNSHPELLTVCYGKDDKPDGSLGPMDPTKESTFKFASRFFKEISEVFPDKYLHLGGDEVDFKCWQSNPEITKFMNDSGFGIDYKKLEGMYIDRAVQTAYDLNLSAVVWQEVFDNKCKLDNKTVVHVWKISDYYQELEKVTAAGHLALLSSCWYLDHLKSGGDWLDMYKCEPLSFNGDERQKTLVQGGEACMWSEVVDVNNVVPRVYPRASAMAERLWSDSDVTDGEEAARRLEEFRCRLVRRGIQAQPANGPGYCPGEIFD